MGCQLFDKNLSFSATVPSRDCQTIRCLDIGTSLRPVRLIPHDTCREPISERKERAAKTRYLQENV